MTTTTTQRFEITDHYSGTDLVNLLNRLHAEGVSLTVNGRSVKDEWGQGRIAQQCQNGTVRVRVQMVSSTRTTTLYLKIGTTAVVEQK